MISTIHMNLPFSGISGKCSFGSKVRVEHPSAKGGERIYAFVVSDRMAPQVFDYSPNEEGFRSLANLVRAEDVLAIIRGREANFESASVVKLTVGNETQEDYMLLPRVTDG